MRAHTVYICNASRGLLTSEERVLATAVNTDVLTGLHNCMQAHGVATCLRVDKCF